MEKKDFANAVGIIGLLIAIFTLFFGDDLYGQITGHSFFSSTPPTKIATASPIIADSDEFPESVRVKDVELKLFEGGLDVSRDQRVYTNTFDARTRVGWTLVVEYRIPWKKIDSKIDYVYYNTNAGVSVEGSLPWEISPFSSSLEVSSEFAFDYLQNGKYTFIMYVNDMELARTEFTIE